mgnify:CR=1 FL=1
MIFPGAMELVRTRGHFVVDVITDRVAGTNFGHCCRLAVTVIELVTYALICWYGIVWVLRAQATFQSIPLAAGPLGLRRHPRLGLLHDDLRRARPDPRRQGLPARQVGLTAANSSDRSQMHAWARLPQGPRPFS